jgi:two-component system sensor histidine kinase and response regulator WspE
MVMNEIIDNTLLELFRTEIEIHTLALEDGLLDLEKCQTAEQINPLMRAAHSIKGAARIVGLDFGVALAHAMEDLLSAAQEGKTVLNSQDLDWLLEGNDIFKILKTGELSKIPFQLNDEQGHIENLVKSLTQSVTKVKEEKATCEVPEIIETVEQKIKNSASAKAKLVKPDPIFAQIFQSQLLSGSEAIRKILSGKEALESVELDAVAKNIDQIQGGAKIIGFHNLSDICNQSKLMLNHYDKLEPAEKKSAIQTVIEINDLFNYMARSAGDDFFQMFYDNYENIQEFSTKIENLIKQFEMPKNSTPITKEEPTELAIEAKPSSAEAKKAAYKAEKLIKSKDEVFVKVSTTHLNKVMAYASESHVQVNNTAVLEKDILSAKSKLMSLITELESMDISNDTAGESAEKYAASLQLAYSCLREVTYCYERFEHLAGRLDSVSDRLYDATLLTRMEPFSEGTFDFKRNVRDLAKELGKEVNLVIEGAGVNVDRDILEKLQPPLIHLLRNAIDHGIEMPDERERIGKPRVGTVEIKARHSEGLLIITVSEDGNGIDTEKLRKKIVEKGFVSEELSQFLDKNELYEFLFLPRFSTKEHISEISGRGVGLDVVFNMVHEVGGVISIESALGVGTTFKLRLPLTLSVIKTILILVNNEIYALPINNIERIYKIKRQDLKLIENNYYFNVNDETGAEENIGIVSGKRILYNGDIGILDEVISAIVLTDRQSRYGLIADKIIGQSELVVMPLDPRLGSKIPLISAGSILDDGSAVLILDTEDMVRAMDAEFNKKNHTLDMDIPKDHIKKKILVVDDSITVRELERKLLENKGYDVTIGIDGIDGWNLANKSQFDLVVSDIDMPRMNGIDLVKRLKTHAQYRDTPIMIVSYKDREEDKIAGKNAGANYYLTKSSFADDSFILAVEDLIGEA